MHTLVGKPAPDFTAAAVLANGEVVNNFNLNNTVKGKYALIFFYPLDFTFVCPSELIALNNRFAEFKKRNIEVMAISIDSQFTHSAWRNTPEDKGGIGEVGFTLVADTNHAICKAYGVQHEDAGVAYRGAFIIDKEGNIRAQHTNDLPLGRNVDELLRLFDALAFHEEHGEVCPANWNPGDNGMVPTKDGVASYLKENANKL